MTLWLITGINVGLTLANVMIALFNLRLFRARSQYLKTQIDFYKFNTPDYRPPQNPPDVPSNSWGLH